MTRGKGARGVIPIARLSASGAGIVSPDTVVQAPAWAENRLCGKPRHTYNPIDLMVQHGPYAAMISTRSKDDASTAALGRLERMLADPSTPTRPPVHLWNPEARPDIGLAIEHDGSWTHQGDPFTRRDLAKLFASVLRRESDGAYFLVTPTEKVPVRVRDVPFLAVEMEVSGSGTGQKLVWRTNFDDVVMAGPEHPMRFEEEEESGGVKPYVTVRDGLEARITRALWYDLVELAETVEIDGIEQFGVWSDGCFFALAEAAALAELMTDSAQP